MGEKKHAARDLTIDQRIQLAKSAAVYRGLQSLTPTERFLVNMGYFQPRQKDTPDAE